jgi:hypothetical protein
MRANFITSIGGNANAKMTVSKPSGGHFHGDMDGPVEMVYGVLYYHQLEPPTPKMPIKWSKPYRFGVGSSGIAMRARILLFFGTANKHLEAKLLDDQTLQVTWAWPPQLIDADLEYDKNVAGNDDTHAAYKQALEPYLHSNPSGVHHSTYRLPCAVIAAQSFDKPLRGWTDCKFLNLTLIIKNEELPNGLSLSAKRRQR